MRWWSRRSHCRFSSLSALVCLFARCRIFATSIRVSRLENLLLFGINPVIAGYNDAQTMRLCSNLRQRLSTLPGVISVSYSGEALLSGSRSGMDVHLDGAPAQTNIEVGVMTVGPDYLPTMKIPLIAGTHTGTAGLRLGRSHERSD